MNKMPVRTMGHPVDSLSHYGPADVGNSGPADVGNSGPADVGNSGPANVSVGIPHLVVVLV